MSELSRLLRRLFIQYAVGSIVAVVGVGGSLMLTYWALPVREFALLVATVGASAALMIGVDGWVLRHDVRPLVRLLDCPKTKAPADWARAYHTLLRLPAFAFRLILGPHWLSVCVSSMVLTVWEIHRGWLHIGLYEVLLAALARLLITGMHAIIEYSDVRKCSQCAAERGVTLSLGGLPISSIRTKLHASILFVGTRPICFFTLASGARLIGGADLLTVRFMLWVLATLTIGIGFSWIASTWLARSVERPIVDLIDWLAAIQRGEYGVRADDIYPDEFVRVVQGFNHLAAALEERQEATAQVKESYFATLAAALDARDPYTAGHSQRVAEYAVRIAERAGLDSASIRRIRRAGLLHDIGKIGIPDAILMKPGPLTPEEYAVIQTHSVVGEFILRRVQPADALAPLLPGVRSHHERYDGRGYPDGLAGEAIPLDGRILAVADAFDAMTSDRPYRRGMSVSRALALLEAGAATQWDPKFVRIFADLVREGLGPVAGFKPPDLTPAAAEVAVAAAQGAPAGAGEDGGKLREDA